MGLPGKGVLGGYLWHMVNLKTQHKLKTLDGPPQSFPFNKRTNFFKTKKVAKTSSLIPFSLGYVILPIDPNGVVTYWIPL